MPGIVIAFVLGFLLGLFIAWFFFCRQQAEEKDQIIARLEGEIGERDGQIQDLQSSLKDAKARAKELKVSVGQRAPEVAVSTPAAEVEKEIEPDDLKIIEGIGPKISSVLQEAGIKTFAQLAAAKVSHLDAILEQTGLKLANPATWPEQAKLAAEGNWAALETLQDELKGGMRE